MSRPLAYDVGAWKEVPHHVVEESLYLRQGSLELEIEPLTNEELSKMDRIDLSRTEPAGDWGRKVARKTPIGGRRITIDHVNYRETGVKVWFPGEELKIILIPIPEKKEELLVFEYSLKNGDGKFTETKIVRYG